MTVLEEIQQRLKELPLEKQSEVLDFVTFLQAKDKTPQPAPEKVERGKRILSALKKVVELNIFKDIIDPVEWQRRIRRDRPLPGRAS